MKKALLFKFDSKYLVFTIFNKSMHENEKELAHTITAEKKPSKLMPEERKLNPEQRQP